MTDIENPYDGLSDSPSTGQEEPNPYEPPKSLEVPSKETGHREIPPGVTYLRPLARRRAAIGLTAAEGGVVALTMVAVLTTGFQSETEVQMLDYLRFAVSSAAFVVFLSWFYRKYKNLYVFSPERMRCTPGWAVGYWFVPFLNLVRPIQCVYDIWRAGAVEGEIGEGNPILGLWWGLWITSGVFSQVAVGTGEMTLIAMSYVVDLSLIGLTVSVIRILGARQDRKARSEGLLDSEK